MHTHLLHAHFSAALTLRVHFALFYACYTHAWLKGVCSAHAVISLSSHLLLFMFHPSLFLLFLDGHFETTPDYDLIDVDVHDFLPNFPDPEAQVKRTPQKDELFGFLAKSALNTCYEPPKSSTSTLPWITTRCSSTIRTTNSPTSRKPRTRKLANSVFTHCLKPLFCTFLIGDFVPQRESNGSMQSGTVARQRKRTT